jgi:polysaccharide biosynthesis/export protein
MFRKLGFNTVPAGFTFLLLLFLFSSCANTKEATYFYGTPEGSISSNTTVPESVIQKNDILSISISSLSAEASAMFNPVTPSGSTTGAAGAGNGNSYLVGSDGSIQFPLLGTIKTEGLTKAQLRDKITNTILEKKLLVDPIVSIRFLNFRVTVLGEVAHPTVVSVQNEKISLLEALGLAGDLTIYAKRTNVMVIREENNKKIIERLDLNSTELFTSPYYYLQSNDIVYVEPNKARIASTSRSNQWLPILFSGLTLAALVADRVIK